jgi:ATP-dependent RNA helicase DeaD
MNLTFCIIFQKDTPTNRSFAENCKHVEFKDLQLTPSLLKGIEALGFIAPMPVQEQVIPVLLNQSTDLIALAQTGTGKTAAFGLPLLHLIDSTKRQTQALILCPTRELCMQIAGDLRNYAQFMENIRIVPIYGGASFDVQLGQLVEGPQIIVATPGRMLDMIKRKKARLSEVRWVVLDEADEMLNMGFQDELNGILETTPPEKNTLLFSATLPSEVERLSGKYMYNPIKIIVGQRNASAANVKHIYYTAHARDRYQVLKRIADYNPNIYAIIFCRTRIDTQEIADKLVGDGYSADALHGDLSQAQRDHVMNKFRVKNVHLLVATDVAARGLDVDDLTHVINYSLPDDGDSYIHRSGRTGRAGKSGISVSIINLKEKGKIKMLERLTKKEFAQAKIPTGRQVCEKQLFSLVDRLEKVEVKEEEIDSFLPVIYRKLEAMSREELIQRFVSTEFNRFLEYYRDSSDLSVEERYEEKRGGDGDGDRNFTKVFISLGRRDGIKTNHLIGMINELTNTRSIKMGRIDIMFNSSFVEVDSRSALQVIDAFADAIYNGRKVTAAISAGRDGAGVKPERSNFKPKTYGDKPKTYGGKGKSFGERKPYGDREGYSARKSRSDAPRERSSERSNERPKYPPRRRG